MRREKDIPGIRRDLDRDRRLNADLSRVGVGRIGDRTLRMKSQMASRSARREKSAIHMVACAQMSRGLD